MNGRKVIGLTGGIASGKSVAAQMFADLGAYIIDTDVLSREVSAEAEVAELLAARFPRACVQGVLDRRALRSVVFADAGERAALEAILHPRIRKSTAEKIGESTHAVTVVVVPLLFEAGFDALTPYTVTVSCPEALRIERLMKRDTISREQATRMIAAQWSDAAREARANVVLYNGGSLAELRAQVGRLYCEWGDR